MLSRSPRAFQQLFRQTGIQDGLLRTSLRRDLTGAHQHVTSKAIVPLRRSFATTPSSILRPSNQSRLARTWRSFPSRNSGARRHNSQQTTGGSGPGQDVGSKPKSMSERMKEMSRKYGWLVMGIYLGLSALDFPFCFLAVRWLGAERVTEVEHAIVSGFWGIVEKGFPSMKARREDKERLEAEVDEATKSEDGAGVVETAHHKGQHEEPSIWTQLVLAYAVHKSLIFFRIPITLAITPKVVKMLRARGWNIGKAKPK